ncbi:hypothetical protein HYC85_020908 [Camellia sinensis]|uniref:Uncharacterized protein n=1 Tax=Camellia sinensis TaxID=4442 RepID=A0A7J7GUU5_CAMSI|nr:hypothetical protein HYC85_020908 [Camellia sinensis]
MVNGPKGNHLIEIMIRHRVQQFLNLLPLVGVIVLQNTQNLISGGGDCSGRLTTAQLLFLFLLNSTMRVCYHGSRTLGSLVSFYDDVTEISQAISNENKVTFLGLKIEPLNGTYLERIGQSSDDGKNNHPEQESCPFSWARSPENLLQQETYLALAIVFVLLRLLYFLLPTLSACTRLVWRLYIPNMKLKSLWEHPPAYLNRAIQLFNSVKEPCKRSNLQEGAMNAKAWASKSLASVSFGDANTSWVVPFNTLILTQSCRKGWTDLEQFWWSASDLSRCLWWCAPDQFWWCAQICGGLLQICDACGGLQQINSGGVLQICLVQKWLIYVFC